MARNRIGAVPWLLLGAACLLTGCSDGHQTNDAGQPDPADFAACQAPSDCIVAPRSCCGSCGAPTRGDAVALAADRAADYRDAACDETGCPACAPLFVDPTLVATCRDRRCELVDLREHEATACSDDSECRVRTPDCCPCGGDTSPGRLIGVSSENAYANLVCDPEQACDDCLPVYPDEVTLSCNADDRCETHDARLPFSDAGSPDAGGRPSSCSLPPDSGSCEAYMPRYYFDPESGRCALFIYGGCDGNDNRFDTAAECASTCQATSPLPLASCEVDGVLRVHGEDGFGDPVSCNTCSCFDGQLACTDIACDEPCPDGRALGIDCAQCGPVDNCEVVRTGCLPSCEQDEDCQQGSCQSGTCRALCG